MESVAEQLITTEVTGKAVTRLHWLHWLHSDRSWSLQHFSTKISTLQSFLILVTLVFTDMMTSLYETSEGSWSL